MKKILLLWLMLPLCGAAQVLDDFSDGDFTADPVWTGDTAEFKMSTYANGSWSQQPRLQLNGSVAGISYAVTAATFGHLDNMEWDFWARLSFGTSSSNNARIYLVSDQADLEGSLNGYYVMFGNDSSDTADRISFWRQEGLSVTPLIQGNTAITNAARNYRIKVTRDETGRWELLVDTLGQYNYFTEGSALDTSVNSSSCLGVFCRYTLTNKTGFYFDDLYAGPRIVDTVPPEVISVSAVSSNQTEVTFSEFPQTQTAENPANYQVAGIGNPLTAEQDAINPVVVHLTFAASFTPGELYNLEVSGVSDPSANVMPAASIPFSWYEAKAYDVVFNEIMADPEPAVSLPAAEYLEILNRTSLPVSLNDWTLEMGSTSVAFPDVTMAAGACLILTGAPAVSALSVYGPCAGFSAFSIPNAGCVLTLRDRHGEIIHRISWDDAWYHDPTKSGGGWSIEQMDADNPCEGDHNWKASVAVSGGTPGAVNSVWSPNPDQQAPELYSIVPETGNRLLVIFSESIDPSILSDTSLYAIDPVIGAPLSAVPGTDQQSVVLNLPVIPDPFTVYTLHITGTLTDCAGNFTTGDSLCFSFYQAKQHDLVINEIMADPEPVIGLPNAEYIELYNRTGFPVSLKGYTLLIGTVSRNLPGISIQAGDYLILCPSNCKELFASVGTTAEVPGLILSNTGAQLTLLDSLHRVISAVSFSDAWYQNPVKAEGGWSLEQKDPLNPCGGAANWTASLDVTGGTPGKMNSVNASNPDNQQPGLIRAGVSRFSTDKVTLFFDEPLDSTSLQNPVEYIIDNGIGNPVAVKLVPPDNAVVILTLPQELQSGVIYTATLTEPVRDCVGNPLSAPSSVRFAVPDQPDSADLVINEVLFDPVSEGADFVELFNRSSKVFDLSELYLADWDTVSGTAIKMFRLSTTGFLLFPGEYVVVTTDPGNIKKGYRTLNPLGFAEMETFPSLGDEEGMVTLCTQDLKLIDRMVYDAGLHFPLLTSTSGISLERINFNRSPFDRSNWHSAAESVGYATPAYLNSQFSEALSGEGTITVSPEIFSPDNSGYQDVLNISYQFDEPGYIASIDIFDHNGRLIRSLVRNALLGTSGVFSWDGITEDHEKAGVGIYIIYFEAYNDAGRVQRCKRAAVLAQRMK